MRRAAPHLGDSRRYEILERLSTEAVLEQDPAIARARARLQGQIVAFRPKWDRKVASRARVREILRTSVDRTARKRAYYAFEPLLRRLENPVRDLARKRNELARHHGFRSYPDYRLRWEGFTPAKLSELLDEVSPRVRAAAKVQRDRFADETGPREWYPWDSRFAEEQTTSLPASSFPERGMLSHVVEGVRGWGFSDASLRFMVKRHDFHAGGIEIPVDPPKDVRVLVNPGGGWTQCMILFHEVGHAVHARSTAVHSPILRWYEYIPGFAGFVEGVGTLFEEIPRSKEWIRRVPGVGSSLAEEFVRTRAISQIAGLGGLIARVRAELELYRNPGGNHARTFQNALRRLGAYDEFATPSFVDPFYVDLPIYLQSYVFANLFAKQVRAGMLEALGGPIWPNARFGRWLTKNWFRESGEFDWTARLKTVTGKSAGASAYNDWADSLLRAP